MKKVGQGSPLHDLLLFQLAREERRRSDGSIGTT